MKGLNLIFAGTPEFALPCLRTLAESRHRLKAVYTQPDRPAGRGRKLQPSAVKSWALAKAIPVYQPLNFKEPADVMALDALQADVMIVIAYGLILPQRILASPRLGCINVHASLLPRWRGASPIQQAILHGDPASGVTIMQMDVGMDTGDVLAEISCPIAPRETASTLHDKLAELACSPLLSTLDALETGKVTACPQDSQRVTYAAKIRKEDAAINWHQPVEVIDRQIRAFTPWPIAYTHAGDEVIRIHQASRDSTTSMAPAGTIVGIDKPGLKVATGKGVLCIERLQFAGGKVISVADWLNSSRSKLVLNQVLQ